MPDTRCDVVANDLCPFITRRVRPEVEPAHLVGFQLAASSQATCSTEEFLAE